MKMKTKVTNLLEVPELEITPPPRLAQVLSVRTSVDYIFRLRQQVGRLRVRPVAPGVSVSGEKETCFSSHLGLILDGRPARS